MPQFDLRNIKAAKYVNTQGTVTYTSATKVGDAMTANLELRNAEGRLFATMRVQPKANGAPKPHNPHKAHKPPKPHK